MEIQRILDSIESSKNISKTKIKKDFKDSATNKSDQIQKSEVLTTLSKVTIVHNKICQYLECIK